LIEVVSKALLLLSTWCREVLKPFKKKMRITMVQQCQISSPLISSHRSIWSKTLHCTKCHLNCHHSIIRQLFNSNNRFLSNRILCSGKTLMLVEFTWILGLLEAHPCQTVSLNHPLFKITYKHRDRLVKCTKTTTIRWVAPIWPSCLMKLIFLRNNLFNHTARDQAIRCQTMPSEQFMKKESIRGLLCKHDLVHSLFKIGKLLHQ
jgi:hypothetical protein